MVVADTKDKTQVVQILASAFSENKFELFGSQDGLKIYKIHQLIYYSFEICMRFGKVILMIKRRVLLLYPDEKVDLGCDLAKF